MVIMMQLMIQQLIVMVIMSHQLKAIASQVMMLSVLWLAVVEVKVEVLVMLLLVLRTLR
jgi:hypothetical protein